MDAYVRQLIEANRNLLVPWYLIASYLYYHEDESIISDGLYDEICERLVAEWDEIEHRHKSLINRGDLEAGSGFSLKAEDYPAIVKGAAHRLIRRCR